MSCSAATSSCTFYREVNAPLLPLGATSRLLYVVSWQFVHFQGALVAGTCLLDCSATPQPCKPIGDGPIADFLFLYSSSADRTGFCIDGRTPAARKGSRGQSPFLGDLQVVCECLTSTYPYPLNHKSPPSQVAGAVSHPLNRRGSDPASRWATVIYLLKLCHGDEPITASREASRSRLASRLV